MNKSEHDKNSIQYIKGVGQARAAALERLGVFTVQDILEMYPREYEDHSIVKKICELRLGDTVTVRGRPCGLFEIRRIRKNLSVSTIKIDDGTGQLTIVFYNREFVKNQIKQGIIYSFYGEVSKSFKGLELQNPVFEIHGLNSNFEGILPVYPLTKDLSQNILRKIVKSVLDSCLEIEDLLPVEIREAHKLCGKDFAIRNIHFPLNHENLQIARHRLVFEELMILQCVLAEAKNNYTGQDAVVFAPCADLEELINSLPFTLTASQNKVIDEIKSDMYSSKVMNRLVQGDVGSGKTAVAIAAMYIAIKSGYQAGYMAPTEILADQHFQTVKGILEPFGIKVSLLTGSIPGKARQETLFGIEDGTVQCVVGTHAIIQKNVVFKNLGLVITDEQHRFGVRQRAALSGHGKNPDVLVMTATPIPRTLALILYGDLDISVIDTLPQGRVKIKTYIADDSLRDRIYKWIVKLAEEGRQIYIVHPSIEPGETAELKSASEHYEALSRGLFHTIETGLIHGKMKSAEKEEVMRRFVKGDIKVLFTTTVIEVGVNVPNAVLMVVENAERFGLAQLHQLRGRVGRGSLQSYCVLFNQSQSDIAAERMEIMKKTTDGFVISDKDLEIRGPGEFFGTRQHGLPTLKIANLYTDLYMLNEVRGAAGYILKNQNEPACKKYNELILKNIQDAVNL
ncbi:MAG: ATP-dependent DNA helicase RecG [Clostridiales bacterium]|jgi:ATP-dependent DNA helicase RecG|nr:ATP-dependent DNA helicase RecG [Clostridiales bacterium]